MDLTEIRCVSGYPVSRGTLDILTNLVDLISEETGRQNLISASTISDIWSRHIVDSLQLAKFSSGRLWLDLGSGAGFPGLVIASLNITDVVLIESRKLRYEFLQKAVTLLGLKNVKVIGQRVERVCDFQASVISARAFAPIAKIFSISHRFSVPDTRWILPKGKMASEELESIRTTWQGDFRLEQSVTDPTSSIIIAEQVSRRNPQ